LISFSCLILVSKSDEVLSMPSNLNYSDRECANGPRNLNAWDQIL
jgi:hypothetical protein